MRPTTARSVLGLAAVGALLAWLLAEQAYGSLPTLPGYAPVLAVVMAAAELALARVIRNQRAGRSRGRALEPLQLARAAALAKASSAAGALLTGFYTGYLAWTFPRRDRLAAAADDARMAAVSAIASVVLLLAALLLERSCRSTPDPE